MRHCLTSRSGQVGVETLLLVPSHTYNNIEHTRKTTVTDQGKRDQESRNSLGVSLGSMLPSLHPRLDTKHQPRVGVKFTKQNRRSPRRACFLEPKGQEKSCVFRREATLCKVPLTLKYRTEDPRPKPLLGVVSGGPDVCRRPDHAGGRSRPLPPVVPG